MSQSEIVGVHIPKYKNLTDVWIPWSSGLTLVGANGSGKTNILEVLALLLAPYETLDRTSRIDEAQGIGASIVIRNDPLGLPLAPEWFAKMDFSDIDYPFSMIGVDVEWWRREGITTGTSFQQAIRQAEFPDGAAQIVEEAIRAPLVQYTLQAVRHANSIRTEIVCEECNESYEADELEAGDPCPECEGTTVSTERPTNWSRLFRRTLLHEGRVPALDDRVRNSWLSVFGTPVAGSSGFEAVLELPLGRRTPATLQWYPQNRSNAEIRSDIRRASRAANRDAQQWVKALGALILAEEVPGGGDATWWADDSARGAANAELALTAPGVQLGTAGDEGDWLIDIVAGDARLATVGSTEGSGLTQLSAGQRRWVDEAVGTATRALHDLAERCSIYSRFLDEVPQDVVLREMERPIATARVAGVEIGSSEFWSPKALDEAASALDPALVAIAKRKVDDANYPVLRLIAPEYDRLRTPIVVRAFDEPEAHLHIDAVRRVTSALQTLRERGQQVVISTHNREFVDLDGWRTLHVRHGRVQPVAGRSLAADLGYSRGDLLSGIEHVLIVEGSHDVAMLDVFHGSQLRSANVALIRMNGTHNLPNIAELDFIERYVDAPVTVMLDYTRLEKVLAPNTKWENLRDEERKLRELDRAMRKLGKSLGKIGLDLPDIVAYLDGDVIKDRWPGFPGWTIALREFKSRRQRPSFKPFLKERYGVELEHTRVVQEIAAEMRGTGGRPWADLDRKVNSFLAHVAALPTDESSR